MRKIWYKLLIFMLGILFLCQPVLALAAQTGTNQVIIQDDAGLFTQDEIRQLTAVMSESLTYGHMLLVTTEDNPYYDSYTYADQIYLEKVGAKPGIIFLIDLDERVLWLSAMDGLDYTLSDYDCEIITDNVYTYASQGNYFKCAERVFSQVRDALIGKYVPKPMKYICNLLISLLLALILNAVIAMQMSKKKKPTNRSWQANMISHCKIINPTATFLRETKHYRPQQTSSGSSHASHSSGRSSSGGGHRSSSSHSSSSHHSSGGGHRF